MQLLTKAAFICILKKLFRFFPQSNMRHADRIVRAGSELVEEICTSMKMVLLYRTPDAMGQKQLSIIRVQWTL